MLQIEHVSKTFNPGTINEKKALIDLNVSLKDGDFATIVGSNGAGKSQVSAFGPVSDLESQVLFMLMKVRSFWIMKTLHISRSIYAAEASGICFRILCLVQRHI